MNYEYIYLKPKYKLLIKRNSNILFNTETGKEELFLSPVATMALEFLACGFSVTQTIEKLAFLFESRREVVQSCFFSLRDKLQEYLIYKEECQDSIVHPIQIRENILKSNRYPYGLVKRSVVPEKIVFNITNYCPRECIYCFNGAICSKKHKTESAFLSIERFKCVLQEAKEIGVKNIEIGGGDPFVFPDIVHYLALADEFFPNAWGTSTKAFIPVDLAKKIAELKTPDIQISLDAFDEKVADILMGVKGSCSEILRSFDHLISAGVIPSAKMVITSLNIHLIKSNFIRFAEMGIRTIRANSYMMSPNRHANRLYPTIPQIEIFNQDVSEILEYANKNHINTDIAPIAIPESISDGERDVRVLCGASSSDMYIRHDGMMIFCGQINNCEELTIGNLKNYGVMELWQSSKMSHLFDPDFLKDQYKDSKCYTCEDYYACFPKRCYVRSFVNSSAFFDVDPACVHGVQGYVNRG